MNYRNLRPFFLLFFFIISQFIYAEGTKELAPNGSIDINGNPTNDVAALNLAHASYNNFASWNNNDPNARLYINIQNTQTECIYLGFHYGHLNRTGQNPTRVDFEFRVLDPNGNVVYGPITVDDTNYNITNWQEGFNGPSQLHGTGGYNAMLISNIDLESQSYTGSGDYYIEFRALGVSSSEFLIDYWDISVADCSTTTPTYRPGRVWSYNWALFAINDYGFPNRPFNGSFYVCAPDDNNHEKAFISKIDFNNSGFKPAAFNIAFNSYGTANTGTIEENRRSVENMNSTTAEYAIYLNDPIELCDEAEQGSVSINGITFCNEDFCILINSTKTGLIEVLLDLDGPDNIYTPGTSDRLITVELTEDDINRDYCISWDGLDGFGNKVNGTIPIVLNYSQGVYHFPIYDAELMENGFTVESVRPNSPPSKLFYDDRNISESNGTGEPSINLDGCTIPCHTWTTYIGSAIPGFGNLHTINTWWFSQRLTVEEEYIMPQSYICSISGIDSICSGETSFLSASLDTDPPGGTLPSDLSVNWTGPSIISSPEDVDIFIDEPGVYTVTFTYTNPEGNACTSECSFTVHEKPAEECCILEVECPSVMIDTFSCIDALPDLPLNNIDLEKLGIIISDPDCINLLIVVEDTKFGGAGCSDDPLRVLRTIEIVDDANNDGKANFDEQKESCLSTFLVIDDIFPIVTFPEDVTLECTFEGGTGQTGEPTVTENCGEPLISYEDIIPSDYSCDGTKPIKRVWTVSDSCQNTLLDTQYVYINDASNPELEFNHPLLEDIPSGGTLFYPCLAKDKEWSLPDLGENPVIATDNCEIVDITFKEELIGEGNCIEDGYLARYKCTWIAEDGCGNTDSIFFYLNLIDVTPPEFANTPDDITILCGQEIPESEIEAIDECQCCNIEMTEERDMGSCEEGNVMRRIWTATDLCGNSSTYTQLITLIDENAPELSEGPGLKGKRFNRTYQLDCETGFGVLYGLQASDVIASDDCGEVDVTINRTLLQEGRCGDGSLGKWEVTWTATDRCGNTTEQSLFLDLSDNEAPTLVEFPPHNCVDTPDPTEVKFSDNCDRSVSYDYIIDTVYSEICKDYTILRYHYTFQDDCGNSGTASQTYIIGDDVAPEITFRNGYQDGDVITIECSKFAQLNLENLAIVKEQCNGDYKLQLINHTPLPEPCRTDSRSLFEWIATDLCGNESRAELTFNVVDTEAPTIVGFRSSITLNCGEETTDIYELRDCTTASYSFSDEIEQGTCENNYIINRTIRVVDECNNTREYNQKITYSDDEGPIMTSDAVLCGRTSASRPQFADLCGSGVRSASLIRKDTFKICDGYIEIIERWRAEDNCGNISYPRRTLVKNDVTPEIKIKEEGYDISYVDTNFVDCNFPELTKNSFEAHGACGLVPFTFRKHETITSCEKDGAFKVVTIDIYVNDRCQDGLHQQFIFAYQDDEAPIFNDYPEDITLSCAKGDDEEIFAVDNCSNDVPVIYVKTTLSDSEYLEKWTATDACGNIVSHERKVTLDGDMLCDITYPEPIACWSTFTATGNVYGGTAPYTYDWQIVSGECEINFNSDDKQSVDITILTGSVHVILTVTDANGCQSICEFQAECEKAKKSEQRTSAQVITTDLYPNPTADFLNLKTEAQMEKVFIYDMKGQMMMSYSEIHQLNYLVDLSKLVEGNYLIVIETADAVTSHIITKIPGQR